MHPMLSQPVSEPWRVHAALLKDLCACVSWSHKQCHRLVENCDVHAACRAWQLFDWVRALPEGHSLQRLCDANTYSTMITLCGPWQQLRRALQLVAEMRNRSLECGIQVHHSPSAWPLFDAASSW